MKEATVSGRPGLQNIGQRLDVARQVAGLSQQELAQHLNTSQATVSKLLRNLHQPRPALLSRVEVFIDAQMARQAVVATPSALEAVIEAWHRSGEFRDLVAAGLKILNSNE